MMRTITPHITLALVAGMLFFAATSAMAQTSIEVNARATTTTDEREQSSTNTPRTQEKRPSQTTENRRAEEANTVGAENESPTTTKRSEIRAEGSARAKVNMADRDAFKTRATELRANAAVRTDIATERRADVKAKVSAQVETRLRTVMANMQQRIEASIARLTSVADRIEARAELLAERGIDTAAAIALVAEARIELRNASLIVNESLAAEVAAALEAEDPRGAFEFVKASVADAGEHIRTAHALLREAVAELKSAVQTEAGSSAEAVRAESSLEAEATTTVE